MLTLLSRPTRSTLRASMPAQDAPPPAPAPDPLTVEIDANGSPISVDRARWFICFVPGLQKQWWHRFVEPKHRHVFAIRRLSDERWLLVEPWWTRLMVNVLSFDEAIKFLRWGAAGHILEVAEAIPGRGSQVRGWSNCAVLMTFLLGRSYWTWSPHGLYRRLAADPEVKPVELSRFLSEEFRQVASRTADAALDFRAKRAHLPLADMLVDFGIGVLTAAISPSAIALYKAAVSESVRFKEAAEAFWACGPSRAVERMRDVLEDARAREELHLDDCAAAARRLWAMLRGDLYLRLIFGHGPAPGPREIHEHVASVVAVFLHGARPPEKLAARAANDESGPMVA